MMFKLEALLWLLGKKIFMPKQQGGLGVLNLDLQNKALLLKNVHKLFNREDIP
jgi:hypothetical protein